MEDFSAVEKLMRIFIMFKIFTMIYFKIDYYQISYGVVHFIFVIHIMYLGIDFSLGKIQFFGFILKFQIKILGSIWISSEGKMFFVVK